MSDHPSTVGRYRFLAKLGEGGMARVFLTLSQGPSGFHKLLVMKELRDELADDPEFLSMFLAEARLAAQLSHPNVVQTYEVIQENGRLLIAMEYLEGQPFHVVLGKLGRQNVPLGIQLHILAQTLAGLHYAHDVTDLDGTSLNLVHRDVSPQNVFVTYDGQVKVLDFGIAKCAGSVQTTRAGDFKGKVHYAAPEQILMQPLDRRADVFSVGVMLWEALSGQRLGAKGAEIGIAHLRVNGQEPKVLEVAPDAPPALAAICDRAMATDPNNRYASAAELQADVEAYLAGMPGTSGPRELAALMNDRFARQKANVRSLVETQVKAARAAASENAAVPMVDIGKVASTETTSDGGISTASGRLSQQRISLADANGDRDSASTEGVERTASSGSIPLSTTREQIVVRSIPPPRPSGLTPKSTWSWGLLAAPVTLAVIWAIVTLRGGSTSQGGTSPAVPASQTATAAMTAPPSAAGVAAVASATASTTSSATAAVATSVQLSIHAKPETATVTLDGSVLGSNPFKATFPRDGTTHKVKVSATGYTSSERMVSYQDDVTLEVDLDKIGAPSRAIPAVVPGKKGDPSTAPTAAPDRPAHPIDEKDPYAP